MKNVLLVNFLLIFGLISTDGLSQTLPRNNSTVNSRQGTSQGPGMNKPLTKGQPYRGSSKNGTATDGGLNSNAPKGNESRVKGKVQPTTQKQN